MSKHEPRLTKGEVELNLRSDHQTNKTITVECQQHYDVMPTTHIVYRTTFTPSCDIGIDTLITLTLSKLAYLIRCYSQPVQERSLR